MLEIKIGLDGTVSPGSVVLGNRWENKDERIHFDLPSEYDGYHKYIYAIMKKNSTTLDTAILPIQKDNTFYITSRLTYLAGKWNIYVICRQNEMDLSEDEVDLTAQPGEHVVVTDGFTGTVNANLIEKETVNNTKLDTNLKSVYDDLVTLQKTILDKINGKDDPVITSYNDLTDRPFGELVEWTVIADEVCNSKAILGIEFAMLNSTRNHDFSNDKKLKILFGEKEYVLDAKVVTIRVGDFASTRIVFGNLSIIKYMFDAQLEGAVYDQEMLDTGEPFAFNDSGIYLLEPITDMHIVLSTAEETIKTIDPKFLPEIETVTSWNDLEDKPFYNNSTNVEIFNDEIETSKLFTRYPDYDFDKWLDAIDEKIKKIIVIYDGETYYLSTNYVTYDLVPEGDSNTITEHSYIVGNLNMYKNICVDMEKFMSSVTGEQYIIENFTYDGSAYEHCPFVFDGDKFYTEKSGTHTLQIYDVQGDIKTLDEKVIPREIARYSDIPDIPYLTWDNIVNKPFEDTREIIDFFNGTYESELQFGAYFIRKTFTSEVDVASLNTVNVIYDGIEYLNLQSNVADMYGISLLYVGNTYLMPENSASTLGLEQVDTGEPFCFLYMVSDVDIYTNDTAPTSHTVVVQAINGELKKLDPKFLPDGIGTQSDWNVNDENDPAFVKNRPFYTTDPVETVYLDIELAADSFESALDTYGVSCLVSNSVTGVVLEEGEVYDVIYDGVKYQVECKREETNNFYYLGDFSIIDGKINMTFENYPFCYLVTVYSEIATCLGFFINDIEPTSHTFKISSNVQDVVQIPDKYLDIPVRNGEGEYSLIKNSMYNIASGKLSNAEGDNTRALGKSAHAEGSNTIASGLASHAEGYHSNVVSGWGAHAEGYDTIARGNGQHAQGKWNIEDLDEKYAHIVGNGTSDTKRSNAHTLDWEGNAEFQGDVKANACGGENPISLVDVYNTIQALQATISELQTEIETIKNSTPTYDEETGNLTIGGGE